jgi:alcohol dehydrogenase class IV
MPPELTASTGMDALTQACEAYWNLNHNAASDEHALLAIALLVDALPRAVRDGRDRDVRRAVMRGSLEAGLAFSNTQTTACHGLSYAMTIHWGIPHGQAVGVTLPEVLPLNAAALAPVPGRRAAFCAAFGCATIDDVAERLRSVMRECRLATRLGQLGIDEDGILTIVRDGMRSSRMTNNPYRFTEQALHELLLRIL